MNCPVESGIVEKFIKNSRDRLWSILIKYELKPMITQTDYALWLNNTINLLKQKNYDGVDWENVIE